MSLEIHDKSFQEQPEAPKQQTSRTTTSKRDLKLPSFGIKSRLIGYGDGGEHYELIHEGLRDIIARATADTKQDIRVIKVLKQRHGLNYSGIIIALVEGKEAVIHPLIIEATGSSPEPQIINAGGQRFEITRTPSEAWDADYENACLLETAGLLGIPLDKVSVANSTLIPREFEAHNEARIFDILSNAIAAIYAEYAIIVEGHKGISLADVLREGQSGEFVIVQTINYENVDYIDPTGMPVRQDYALELKWRSDASRANHQINQGNTEQSIMRVYAYTDFDRMEPNVFNGMVDKKIYTPNIIITRMEPTGDFVPTIDLVMLGVVSVISIIEDRGWLQAFRPTTSRGKKGERDYRDIGALNIEGNIENNPTNIGKVINTKTKEFGVTELSSLIQNVVKDGAMISIDVPHAGAESWYTSIFSCLIRGNINKAAEARFFGFLNTLTGKNFSSWAGEGVFEETTNIIQGGYYQGENGIADLRHLQSYLSVANWVAETNQSPELLTRYTNTLYDLAMPTVLRSASRCELAHEMSNRTAVFKQTYKRLTFKPQFLSMLVGELHAVGFVPKSSDGGYNNEMFVKRSLANYSHAGLGTVGSNRLIRPQSISGFGGLNLGYDRRW